MNRVILDSINGDVGENDHLMILGDLFFGQADEGIALMKQIKCKNIWLIPGNHDKPKTVDLLEKEGVLSVIHGQYAQPPILRVVKDGSRVGTFVLSHYPLCSWDGLSHGRMHLFGHVHLNAEERLMPGKACDVGIEAGNYRVFDIEEVAAELKRRPKLPSYLSRDHHSG